MESHALTRVESRFTEIESELQRLRLDTDLLRSQARHTELGAKTGSTFLNHGFLVQVMFCVGCAATGTAAGLILGKLLKLLFAA
jgi:hypothetical protein